MFRRLLLQDACVLINLISSGCFEQIARDGGWQFVVAAASLRKLYTRGSQQPEKAC